jgi:hypothetical protein
MRTRTVIHREFVERFHVGTRHGPVSDSQVDTIEAELNTKLPLAYREFMTRQGPVHTPGTLHDIVERNIEHPDILSIFDPGEAIEGTKAYWSAGMPDEVIGIASDCMGNMIGFRRLATASEDASVVFFDHDFVEVNEIAPSFDEFLGWYLDHLKGPQLTNG